MKTAIFIIGSIFVSIACLGQGITHQLDHDAKTLKRIFRGNANGTTFCDWNDPSSKHFRQMRAEIYGEWWACDYGSSYYTLDTIELYNHRDSRAFMDCSEYKGWRIQKGLKMNYFSYKSNKVWAIDSPGNRKIRVSEEGNDTVIEIYNNGDIEESFHVLKLSYAWDHVLKDRIHILVLKRNN